MADDPKLRPEDFGFSKRTAARIDPREGEEITVNDFYAHMPSHRYIFQPSGELWPASSVNARIRAIEIGTDDKGKPITIPASTWLDKHRFVEQMTWAPGEPQIIEDKLVSKGGWTVRDGARVFNRYQPPKLLGGNANGAGPWLDHIRRLYPNEWQHIVAWLAHRVQFPGAKINHALVLGGSQGIGKDSILYPVIEAVGRWNYEAISPTVLIGRFNGFVMNVLLQINEARDLGEFNRYQFYEATKPITAAPPDTLRVDEKGVKEYSAFNCVGVVLCSNYKTQGLYLPADDRRHLVAWSERQHADLGEAYFARLYGWYEQCGVANVGAFLGDYDLSSFDPKAPPPKTGAFWEIVNSNRSPNVGRLADVLDKIELERGGNKAQVVTLDLIKRNGDPDLEDWLKKSIRSIPAALEECGYVSVPNLDRSSDHLWIINGKRTTVYALKTLTLSERLQAVSEFVGRGG